MMLIQQKKDEFTPVQSRMLSVLADGERHSREELRTCLNDELATFANMQIHVCRLRKQLRLLGRHIICEFYGGGYYYRQVAIMPLSIDR